MGVLNEEKAKEEKVNQYERGEDQDSYEEKAEKELVKEIIDEQRIKHIWQFIPIYPSSQRDTTSCAQLANPLNTNHSDPWRRRNQLIPHNNNTNSLNRSTDRSSQI